MKGLGKKIVSRLLSVLFVASAVLGTEGLEVQAANTITTSYGQVWSAPNTVKIQQTNWLYNGKEDAALTYQAVRNEYESAQLLITAYAKISSFTLQTANLTNGIHTLSADNFTVYVQKYTSVSDSYGNLKMPDALLPMEVASAYGENTISSLKNGALWVTVYIPTDTPAGTYEGTFQLSLNGSSGVKTVDIPVSVQVYDYTLAEEPTVKSLFDIRYSDVAVGELDGSIRMMEQYYDFYNDYRVALQALPLETLSGEEYVDTLKAYWEQISTYQILESVGTASLSLQSKEEILREQVLALAKGSTPEWNLFEKAMIYFIDEPDISNDSTRNMVITKLNRVSEMLQACVDTIQADATDTYATFKRIPNWEFSILDIPKLVTIVEDPVDWLLENQDTEVGQKLLQAMNCICVKFGDDTTMQDLAELCETNGMELWWYTCNYPLAPHGNFDIGDDNLLSARSFTWYQSKYDVEGILYWSASGYTSAVDGEFMNIYNNPNRYHNNGSAPAGDGFLTYPGRPYGVYGPLPSLRLMSLRDGLEEYELLHAAKEQMDATSYEELVNRCYSSLGADTSNLYQDGENGLDFDALRTSLLETVAGFDFGNVTQSSQKPYQYILRQTDSNGSADAIPSEADTEVLLSFNSYNEITGAGLRMGTQFGETILNGDASFITEGTGSWLVRPQGDYGEVENYPSFQMRCFDSSRETTFGTGDFSVYDKVMLDIYNDSNEPVQIAWSFQMQNVFEDYVNTEKNIYMLKPHAWTTCEYDLSKTQYNTALDLTNVRYMRVTFLTEKDSKSDVIPELYLDNLRGHLSGKEYIQEELVYDFGQMISFEEETERYLFSDSRTGNNAMTLSRVAYADCEITPIEEAFGAYVLKGETKATWPSLTAHYNMQLTAGKILSFMVYVAVDESIAEGQTYHLECAGHKVLTGTLPVNQWANIEIELTSDVTSSWMFFNFDDGMSRSKFKEQPVTIYMDQFEVLDEVKGDYYYLDIAAYRSGDTYTHPEKEGYVFAGWYKDKAYTEPVGGNVKKGSAYAKFVDEDVLSVKFQLKNGTTSVSTETNLRMLSSVDSLMYQAVGFRITVNGVTKTVTSDTVYETVYEYVDDLANAKLPTVFSPQSLYFSAFEITKVPEDVFGVEIAVTPIWTTLDGTVVTGLSKSIEIHHYIMDYKKGVTFEKDVDGVQFKKANSNRSIVKYEDTSIGVQDAIYGEYGVQFISTGVKFPYTKIVLDEPCAGNVARLCFKIYVEADETLVKDQVFYVDNDDGKSYPFNCWIESYVKIADGADTRSFFLNFDKTIQNIGTTCPFTIYMDNFYLTEGDVEEGLTLENPAEKYVFGQNGTVYTFEEFDGSTVMSYVVDKKWPYINLFLNQTYEQDRKLYFKVYAEVDESLVTNEVFYVGNNDGTAHPLNQWIESFVSVPAGSTKREIFLNFEQALKTIGTGNITVHLDEFQIR